MAQKIAEKEAALELKKQLFHADEVAMEIEEKQLMVIMKVAGTGIDNFLTKIFNF